MILQSAGQSGAVHQEGQTAIKRTRLSCRKFRDNAVRLQLHALAYNLANFSYRAKSWDKVRRVVAKVEWYPGELVPRVGFIVTNLTRPTERVTRFYDGRGTAEQYIKEGKNAINWTRLSCHGFRNNEVRLQLHVLAYNEVVPYCWTVWQRS